MIHNGFAVSGTVVPMVQYFPEGHALPGAAPAVIDSTPHICISTGRVSILFVPGLQDPATIHRSTSPPLSFTALLTANRVREWGVGVRPHNSENYVTEEMSYHGERYSIFEAIGLKPLLKLEMQLLRKTKQTASIPQIVSTHWAT